MVNLFPGINPQCLCNKHLNSVLAEFNNLLLPSMRKGNSIKGYLDHGCIDLLLTNKRICECVEEYTRRDLDWKYANPTGDDIILLNSYLERYGDISDERHAEMTEMNIHILAFRCPECRTRLIKYKYFGDNSSVTKEC
ncbi:MAG: hypothetical protein WC932_02430 [archaeon]|jgi:hypothetical protein